MESKKQIKEKSNSLIKNSQQQEENVSMPESDFAQFESQFNFSPQTETLLKANVSQQALENIKHIFGKTQTIRQVADIKHQEIQSQFKELRERLNTSSECLQRMKKGIDNIKFSYQTKVLEMQRVLTPGDYFEKQPPQTKEEMAKQMEEIRMKIEKIQNQICRDKEKQHNVLLSYKDAFENVSTTLESIDKGDYSSIKLTSTPKTE